MMLLWRPRNAIRTHVRCDPTTSTRIENRIRHLAFGHGRTSASARRWPGWRPGSRCRRSPRGSRTPAWRRAGLQAERHPARHGHAFRRHLTAHDQLRRRNYVDKAIDFDRVSAAGTVDDMRILLVGAGGVGSAFCAIAARRDFFEQIVVCDYDGARAKAAADAVGDARFSAAQVDATSADAVADLVREHGITHVMNAVDPRFVMPIFDGALAGGADYLDMAMSLSVRHPDKPYEQTGVKLGDEQFAVARTSGRRRAGSRWSASAWSPVCPTCSPGTPPTTCSARSTNSAPATAPTSPSTATSSRRRSRSGRPSRSA